MVQKDRANLVESRANNIINSAINLIEYINENYSEDTADEMQRRLLNSIKNRDPAKFARAVKKLK
jgi:hypothetical protein